MYAFFNRRSLSAPGFTLLELLVVLVIISVMVGFVGPKLAGSISNTNLKAASKRIAASLRYARSQAISESRTYKILFDLDQGRMVIEGLGTAFEHEETDVDSNGDAHKALTIYDLPKDVRFEKAIWRDEEADSGQFRVLFVSSGGSSGGELLLRNERGHRCRITVDVITGTVKVMSEHEKA